MQIGSIITLNDKKEYVVIGKVEYGKTFYYCVACVDDPNVLKFLYETLQDGKLVYVEIHDADLIVHITPMLYQSALEFKDKITKRNN